MTLAFCIEVFSGHVNHCVTFAIEYVGRETVRDLGFGSKGPTIGNGLWEID